ncbi:MAG TPA: glycosyltransferase family 2 protein [Gemmatimonadales bacterium]|nr:glycosyltransferase family 2 protein [Gemmatimonadales bacterium]
MNTGWTLVATGAAIIVYPYLIYPVLLKIIGAFMPRLHEPAEPAQWPMVSVTIPVYNEERQIRQKLERVLAWDYPKDRMQVLVVSDASTDRTDEIVKEFAPRGIELLRLPKRGGKTAAENATLPHLRGEIVVNSDAAIRVPDDSLRKLVIWFGNPTVGVASGRDRSVANLDGEANQGESGYVDYEMWVRGLETQVAGIVGASGCFYAIRKQLHQHLVPEALSRDFAAPLIARRHGYRSVSVDDAIALVPRTKSLKAEYRRKVRTMTRGLETLFYQRALLNPFKYGLFAWELWTHKLIRWLLPVGDLLVLIGLAMLGPVDPWAQAIVAVAVLVTLGGAIGWWWPGDKPPRVLATAAYLVSGNVAALQSWVSALRGDLNPIWEPTRRPVLGETSVK